MNHWTSSPVFVYLCCVLIWAAAVAILISVASPSRAAEPRMCFKPWAAGAKIVPCEPRTYLHLCKRSGGKLGDYRILPGGVLDDGSLRVRSYRMPWHHVLTIKPEWITAPYGQRCPRRRR